MNSDEDEESSEEENENVFELGEKGDPDFNFLYSEGGRHGEGHRDSLAQAQLNSSQSSRYRNVESLSAMMGRNILTTSIGVDN
jgi:hypothetical protein